MRKNIDFLYYKNDIYFHTDNAEHFTFSLRLLNKQIDT